MGPSGAGKSTLLYALMGTARYGSARGRLWINGREMRLARLRRILGYVPQARPPAAPLSPHHDALCLHAMVPASGRSARGEEGVRSYSSMQSGMKSCSACWLLHMRCPQVAIRVTQKPDMASQNSLRNSLIRHD